MENLRYIFFFFTSFTYLLVVAQSDIAEQAQLANEYFVNSDYEKAEDIFKKLDNDSRAIPLIHSNYFDLLIKKGEFKRAEKYISNVIKRFPGQLTYPADLVLLYDKFDKSDDKQKALSEIIDVYGKNQYQLKLIADNLVNRNLPAAALTLYKESRRIGNNPYSFALDIAAIYRMMDLKEEMTEEYLLYATVNQRNVRYIKNVFQQLLSEPDDLDYLEKTLIEKVQNNPDNEMYMELLIWVEIQRRNYYGAYIQARALDKRTGKPGSEVMEVGRIAMNNKAWRDAMDIFEYVYNEYGKGSPYYTRARQLYIESKEGLVLSTFPVDKSQVLSLTQEYQQLYDEFGATPTTLAGLRNKARLLAFYLDDKISAINALKEIINTPGIDTSIRDRAKLDLGDIYLLIDEPWESTLIYSQVDKANKYGQLSYEAKLRNAKLNYYVGNFALSKSHLDILKNATTKEIANDALDLSVLIKNNTILDTTDATMQKYASIDLLIYQNKKEEAIDSLRQFKERYKNHSLNDEVLWQLSNLSLEKGEYKKSLSYLDELIASFGFDILADDAKFLKAEIYHKYLEEEEEAASLYRDFLTDFPGSMYAAEARKRYRKLRGDVIN